MTAATAVEVVPNPTPLSIAKRVVVFVGCGQMILLCNMDATIIPAVIPEIGEKMAISVSTLQWLTNGYCLAAMSLFVIAGRLSDLVGRRPVFLLGTVLFLVGSVLAAICDSFPPLVAARVLQGTGFAFVLSVSLLMSASVFPSHRRGLGVGVALTLAGAGQALGPLVGGWVLRHWSWHAVFWVNVPPVVLSTAGIWMVYPRERSRSGREVDVLGAALLGVTLLSLSMCCAGIGKDAPFGPLGFALAALIFGVVFLVHQRRVDAPLFKLALLKRRDYALTLLIRCVFMGVYGAFLFFVPFFLQRGIGLTAIESGILMLAFAITLLVTSSVAGAWVDRAGSKIPIVTGAILGALGLVLCASLPVEMDQQARFILPLCLFGVGTGTLIPSTAAAAIASLPAAAAGEGLGMFFTVAFMGASLGVPMGTLQFDAVVERELTAQLASTPDLAAISDATRVLVGRVADGSAAVETLLALADGTGELLAGAVRAALHQAFSAVMISCASSCVFVVAVALFLKGGRRAALADLNHETEMSN